MPLAATSIAQRIVPAKRITDILEGETWSTMHRLLAPEFGISILLKNEAPTGERCCVAAWPTWS